MTPLFCWVFLLALVGCAVSVPPPLVNDACALVCNPGAETEGERERRERDPIQYPRYPKGVCKLQSSSDQDQARVLVSHCLKLCAYELSDTSELNCFVLRSSIESQLGCYCPALVPLSSNTMRLHENWRITHLVNELAKDLVSIIFASPIDRSVICEIHQEVFAETANTAGILGTECRKHESSSTQRNKREVDEGIFMEKIEDSMFQQPVERDIQGIELETKAHLENLKLEEINQITPMRFGNHFDFVKFCQESCRTKTPESYCDCPNLNAEEF